MKANQRQRRDQQRRGGRPSAWDAFSARRGRPRWLPRRYPLAISLLSAIYIVGLPFIAMAPETAGRPLAR